MQLNDILEMIEKRKKELSTSYKRDSGCTYLKKFVNHNKVSNLMDLINMDAWECIKCLFYIRSNREHSIEEYSVMFDQFHDLFAQLSATSIRSLLEVSSSLLNTKKMNNIIAFLKVEDESLVPKINLNDSVLEELVLRLKKLEDNGVMVSTYFELLKADGEVLLDVLDFYCIYTEIKEEWNCQDSSVRNREKIRLFEEWIYDNYYVKGMIAEVNGIRSFIQEEEKKEKDGASEFKQEVKELTIAEAMLKKACQREEIVNASSIVSKIKDLTIKRNVLQFILDYNSQYYDRLEKEYQSISFDKKREVQLLLKRYNINIDNIDQIIHHKLEDLEVIIKMLQRIGVSQNIETILKNCDLESITLVKNYINSGYLSRAYVCSNPDVFYRDSSSISLFRDNLMVLKKYNLNPLSFNDSISTLFIDTSILTKNLEYCYMYGLLPFFKTTNNYHFLENDSLANIIDSFLELGYEKLLESDLGLLNTEHLKRLEVMKSMNMPIDTLDELHGVLDNNYFFIDDDMLDDYIFDVVPYMEERNISTDLKPFLSSSRVYDFKGVYVSKLKVDRLLQEGKSLYQALFTGLKLSNDEYMHIISLLDVTSHK